MISIDIKWYGKIYILWYFYSFGHITQATSQHKGAHKESLWLCDASLARRVQHCSWGSATFPSALPSHMRSKPRINGLPIGCFSFHTEVPSIFDVSGAGRLIINSWACTECNWILMQTFLWQAKRYMRGICGVFVFLKACRQVRAVKWKMSASRFWLREQEEEGKEGNTSTMFSIQCAKVYCY